MVTSMSRFCCFDCDGIGFGGDGSGSDDDGGGGGGSDDWSLVDCRGPFFVIF